MIPVSDQPRWVYKSLLVETKGFFARGVIDATQLDDNLTELGRQGWELVAIVPVSDGNVGTARLLCTFKQEATS
jgi:hypothetical protein